MKKNVRMIVVYAVFIAIAIAVVATQMTNVTSKNEVTKLPTSKFMAAVDDGLVKSATYRQHDARLTGEFWKSDADKQAKKEPVKYQSTFAGEDELSKLMARHSEIVYNVDSSQPSPVMSILLGTVLPVLLLGGVLIYFLNQAQAGNNRAMQFGRSSAKLNASGKEKKVTFKDVAGADEAVEELEEIREFLSNPTKFQSMGAKIPHGVLLVGPPGTGKTLLARAVAGEASVPFYSISGSDFVEMFVGVGASRVRDLFKQAKETAPAIIFIDEIDAVGRQRGAGMGGGHDEREQTLNQLLVEMDGFDVNDSVILIAATNRPDVLDPALLRPGRFDRQIVVDRPDMKGRVEILKVHAQGKPLAQDVDLEILAKRTPGFAGADLANLLNEAALLAARFNKREVGMDELAEAIDRVMSGPERKSRIVSDKEKRIIAYHEAGHALVGHVLDHADQIHKISIIARGQALGYTLALPTEDRFLTSKQEMLDDLVMFLGGRVAEQLACGDVTTGAGNDLERATQLARQMVTRFGMTDALGTQVYGDSGHDPFLGRDFATTPEYSPETAARIDAEVSRLMSEAYARAESVLLERRDQLDLIVDVLIERETIDIEAVTALLDNKWDAYLAEEKRKEQEKAEQIAAIEAGEYTPAKTEHPAAAESSGTQQGAVPAADTTVGDQPNS